MKPFIYFFLILLIPLNFACSSDDDDEIRLVKDGPFAISELNGNWDATAARFTSNNAVTIDVVDDGGTVTMSVQSSGRFTITVDPIDQDAYTASGEMFWEEWEGNYYFAIVWDKYPNEDPDTYGHTYDGNGTIFGFNGGADSGEYDFDNDGNVEPCSINLEFERS